MNYPEPKLNPHCQCRGNPLKQMLCQHGHMTECHFPYHCKGAACSHLAKYGFSDEEILHLETLATTALIAGKMPPYSMDKESNILVSVQPESCVHSKNALTVLEMMRQALRYRNDRLCCVREVTPAQRLGVAILLVGNAAIRDIGSYLESVLKTLPPISKQAAFLIQPDTYVKVIMEQMDLEKVTWAWAEMRPPAGFVPASGGKIIFVVLIGDVVTPLFASELTKRGCTCNLT